MKVEKTVKKGKRTDIHCTDDYGNVRFVVEFKKPSVQNLSQHKDQLWKRYMKPLRADYGILYNGLELIFYERVGDTAERQFKIQGDELGDEDVRELVGLLQKPEYDTQDIERVADYFEKFEDPQERLELVEEASREHFFQNFRLKEDSDFGNLLSSTIELFNYLQDNDNQFLQSAYDFWKRSYAKSPDKVPDDWKPLMEEAGLGDSEEDLYQFMFCLETAYAVFARLILAKSAEDYDFPDVRFKDFIEKEVRDASHRGDIAQSAWASVTQKLIGDLRKRLVSSVFEEDIFYWWTEPFEDMSYDEFFGRGSVPEMSAFGGSLAKILLMLYKFNFSKIEGDPLGILYQQYFDKETRKALGEFYTPQEVVDYILDAVEYEGVTVTDKRLLDPACGSGTFPVTALQRYLKAAEDEAEEKGWDYVLDDLVNKYRIVGFDIHPFATIMAQIQFMLVLLEPYKWAIEDAKEKGDHFTLQRVPIFRTDSLKKETESGDMKITDWTGGEKFSMKIELPIQGEEEDNFFEDTFDMPTPETTRKETDIRNNNEYFATLQALFDVVKDQAYEMEGREKVSEFDDGAFKRTLKQNYSFSGKDWANLSQFFKPFANDILEQINRLQTEFDDGRLVKSIEDIFLAALLKTQEYDYVVGNPPYVDIQTLGGVQKDYLEEHYTSAEGNYDLYLPFMERGVNWLSDSGLLAYINPNRFAKVNYGKPIREFLLEETEIVKYVDLKDSNIFEDAVNYPVINVFRKSKDNVSDIQVARVFSNYDFQSGDRNILSSIRDSFQKLTSSEVVGTERFDCFYVNQSDLDSNQWIFMPDKEREVFNKIQTKKTLVDLSDSSKDDSALFEGLSTGAKKIFVVKKLAEIGDK
ncbi:MAG: N-6 DNA methylase, partial [Candidatus Nanohaloarchaeota archaeon QJJ-7]|nr:N-6 DNA methylase [Candidatus Nanohaloarchaeota archaeon QJJ-7]